MDIDTYIEAFPRPSRRARRPTIVLVAGLPASGKSTFSRRLARSTPIAHVCADGVRMALTDHMPTYSREEAVATADGVRRLASALLHEGFHVAIDAVSLTPEARAYAESAGPVGTPIILVWCQVDEATAADRMARRARGEDPNDLSRADMTERRRLAKMTVAPRRRRDLRLDVSPGHVEIAMRALRDRLRADLVPLEGPGRAISASVQA